MTPIRPKYVMHIKIRWNNHTRTTTTTTRTRTRTTTTKTEDPRPLGSATASVYKWFPTFWKHVSPSFLRVQSPRRTLEDRGDNLLRNIGNNLSRDVVAHPRKRGSNVVCYNSEAFWQWLREESSIPGRNLKLVGSWYRTLRKSLFWHLEFLLWFLVHYI